MELADYPKMLLDSLQKGDLGTNWVDESLKPIMDSALGEYASAQEVYTGLHYMEKPYLLNSYM